MLAFSVRVLTSINVLNDPLAVYQQMLARDFGDSTRISSRITWLIFWDHWQTNVTPAPDDLTVEKMWSKFKSGICIHRQSATLSLYQFWLYSHYQIPVRSDQKESSAGWIKLRLCASNRHLFSTVYMLIRPFRPKYTFLHTAEQMPSEKARHALKAVMSGRLIINASVRSRNRSASISYSWYFICSRIWLFICFLSRKVK